MMVYVNDERRKFESDSGNSFPVIRKEYWERALNQAQLDHERKESIQQDVHGENQNTFEHVKVKVPLKPLRAHERGMSVPMKPHIVRFVHGVRSASRPRALTENTTNKWGIRSTFLRLSLITRLQPTRLVVRKFRSWLRQTQFVYQFL